MRLWCVVPAAGKGLRAGGALPKQYLPLNGGTVIQCTLNRLSQLPVEAIIVPVAADDERAAALAYRDASLIRFVPGGAERADSVLAGLEFIADRAADDDWVLVHDVARPCVRIEDIEGLLRQVEGHPAGGLLANRVRDTMKLGRGDEVAETVPRDQLWHALTPQVFRYALLRDALRAAKAAGVIVTDEAQAVERQGEHPLLVEGARDNIKITWPEDLPMAEAFLRLQAEASA
ncbi:MAG: 2-C-methyl-D-erythritol 4-phosphate cytidylyltransferase [Moraxellaceae bacterium]|jgi:2-C-methyl-D-erythritol 4-phosphate cytidylyltransferase|nr:2-C-methyl-D-erythritol 4-phosphate cytidylyltransferase [Moraxellaceae bacterium]